MDTKSVVRIHTDGTCTKNPGGDGRCGFVVEQDKPKPWISPTYKNTTNNRMELMGVIQALVNQPDGSNLVIYTDSTYVVRAFNYHYKKGYPLKPANKNKILVQALVEGCKLHHNVEMFWEKGHLKTNRWNWLIDKAISFN